jgi:hypothetical protein
MLGSRQRSGFRVPGNLTNAMQSRYKSWDDAWTRLIRHQIFLRAIKLFRLSSEGDHSKGKRKRGKRCICGRSRHLTVKS